MHEFHNDRETVACVIDCLPRTVQDRWFHQTMDLEEAHMDRSEAILEWLEGERRAGIAVHLHNMAKQHSIPTGTAIKPGVRSEPSSSIQVSTDQGLLSGTMLAQQETRDSVGGVRMGGSGPVTTADFAKEVTANRLANLVAKKIDVCPICKERHFYEQSWTKVVPPMKTIMILTHFSMCPRFAAMSSEENMRKLTAHGACLHCSAWDHNQHRGAGGAAAGELKCRFKVGAGECGGKHGVWFHRTTSNIANTGSVIELCDPDCSKGSLRQLGLYKVYRVDIPSLDGSKNAATILVDPGSDTNYVTHNFARVLGLTGTPYTCFLKVVDMEYLEKSTKRYNFDIVDREGATHHIQSLGLDPITTLPDEPDLSPIEGLLDGLPREILDRPQGRVDILLGLGSSSLHGRTHQEWGNLRLLESKFGCGWVIRESHELLRFPSRGRTARLGRHRRLSGQGLGCPSSVRNDGKLDGLRGGSTDAPLRPLLHEVKLPGLGAGGSKQEGLRHKPKLSLHHEVKLLRSSCQESNFGYTGDSSLRLLLPLLLLLVITSLHSSSKHQKMCVCVPPTSVTSKEAVCKLVNSCGKMM